MAEPDHFEEITDELLQLKAQALMCHKSQFAPRPDQPELTLEQRFEWMRERMRQAGEKAGYEYAEAFNRTLIDY
jgi:LmbE family N-acetylglucosaminyl deacetylase